MVKETIIDLTNIAEISLLLDLLTSEQRDYLCENYSVERYTKNEVIYSVEEAPKKLFFLLEGKVKIFTKSHNGRVQIVRLIKSTEFFGYRAILAEENYVTNAIAIEDSVICTVPEEVFISVLKNNNDLAFHFIKALSVDLGIADSRLISLTQKTLPGRLAESLLLLRDVYGLEEDGETINIYLSRKDLADFSNMTAANAIRTLANFVDEKTISVDGRKIKIINEEELTRIAKFG